MNENCATNGMVVSHYLKFTAVYNILLQIGACASQCSRPNVMYSKVGNIEIVLIFADIYRFRYILYSSLLNINLGDQLCRWKL